MTEGTKAYLDALKQLKELGNLTPSERFKEEEKLQEMYRANLDTPKAQQEGHEQTMEIDKKINKRQILAKVKATAEQYEVDHLRVNPLSPNTRRDNNSRQQ